MIARDLAKGILGRIRVGQLTVIEGDSETVFGSAPVGQRRGEALAMRRRRDASA